jgi:hypothetical protein
MSIYDVIAQGQDVGSGINAFARNKYLIQQDQAANQERQQQNAFVRQRDDLAIRQEGLKQAAQIYATTGNMDQAFSHLDYLSQQYGFEPADRQRLAPVLEGLSATYLQQGTQQPASIQEWQQFNKMSPADQERYLLMKRAQPVVPLGGGGSGIVSPISGQTQTVVDPVVATGRDATRAGAITTAEEGARTEAIPARTVAQIKADFDKFAATSQQQGMAELPQVQANAEQAMGVIDALRSHPGLDYLVGAASLIPIVPGSPQADANAYLEQIQGKAFLEAFATLKGGGQITEVEGAKATAAIARLNRAQSKKAFEQALNELYSIAQTGLERAQKKAGSQPASPNVDVQGVKTAPRAVNPQTGETLEYDGSKWVPVK